MRHPLTKTQCICIVLLWMALCYFILVHAEKVDGPLIVTLLLSAGFVIIPVVKSLKKH